MEPSVSAGSHGCLAFEAERLPAFVACGLLRRSRLGEVGESGGGMRSRYPPTRLQEPIDGVPKTWRPAFVAEKCSFGGVGKEGLSWRDVAKTQERLRLVRRGAPHHESYRMVENIGLDAGRKQRYLP